MRKAVLAGLFVAVFGAIGWAQDATAAIQSVINEQIAAFRANDLDTAFSFASPTLKRLFETPDLFGRMVESGYPMVWRPASVRFSSLEERGGQTVQGVIVTDQDGALHVLEYEMIAGEHGWQINGVRLRRSGDAGA